MAGYERQIASAKRIIAKRGQSVSWLVRAEGVTDDAVVTGATKWRPKADPAVDPISWPVVIAFFTLTKDQEESLRGRGIEDTTGFQYGIMAAVPFAPNQKDSVLRSGKTLPIVDVQILAPNGDPLLYEIVFAAPVVIGG